MWMIWVVVGAVASPLVIWWVRGHRRGHFLRRLIAEGLMDDNKVAVFFALYQGIERRNGIRFTQQEYDMTAGCIAAQSAKWAAEVVAGERSMGQAMEDLAAYNTAMRDPCTGSA